MIQNVQSTKLSIPQERGNLAATRSSLQMPSSSIDRITFGDEKSFLGSVFGKISSGISYIRDVIKSIFKTIFFCCSYSGKAEEKLDLKGLISLRKTIVKLRQDFESKKGNRNGLIEWWKGEFGSAPETVQRRIACKHLERVAKGKLGVNAPITDLREFAQKSYEYSDERNKALRFVRDLEYISRGKEQWHPLTPTNVPSGIIVREKGLLQTYLDSIISDLDSQIKKIQNASK